MQSCPMHKEHMKEAAQHQADVEKHGDEAMGFPHDKTTHHFRLYSDGGAIEVTVNDKKDSQNLQAIRSHLTHIVTMFSNGEFSIPMFVHDQVPPGVPVMKEKHAEISYTFEELPAGGRVRIKTENRDDWTRFMSFFAFRSRTTTPGTQPTSKRSGNSNLIAKPSTAAMKIRRSQTVLRNKAMRAPSSAPRNMKCQG